jgi:hypothetical protein
MDAEGGYRDERPDRTSVAGTSGPEFDSYHEQKAESLQHHQAGRGVGMIPADGEIRLDRRRG